jgi:hypothetical protein
LPKKRGILATAAARAIRPKARPLFWLNGLRSGAANSEENSKLKADILISVKRSYKIFRCAAVAVALPLLLISGCRKEQQAVTQVASTAVNAEHTAQAVSAARDQQRAQLARIAIPTKSRYVDVHEPGAWANPFLSFDAQMINLRVTLADANTSTLGQGGLLRPSAARRREVQIAPKDMVEALMALPESAWPYGRVVAIEESPLADKKTRPQIRRQIEAAIQQLNDLGVVVDEWPAR